MTIGALEIAYGPGTPTSTPTEGITFNVSLSNGVYLPQSEPNYTLAVFYGQPDNAGTSWPITTYSLSTNNLQFSGGINCLYAVAQVETSDTSIVGTITTSQALPYSVTIGIPGSSVVTTLEPGQTSVGFDIALGDANLDNVAGVVAAKLDELKQGK